MQNERSKHCPNQQENDPRAPGQGDVGVRKDYCLAEAPYHYSRANPNELVPDAGALKEEAV